VVQRRGGRRSSSRNTTSRQSSAKSAGIPVTSRTIRPAGNVRPRWKEKVSLLFILTQRNCHKIKKRDGKMYQNGKLIPHMTQLQAMEEFENFLQGSEYLIAHGDVDFQTIRALLNKTEESPSYERVQKIDSQAFYKSVMWHDHRITKYGMKTIVQYFGDEATKAAYKTGAHGALCDTVEEEEVSVSHPARCQSTSRVMMYYPG